MGEGVGAFLNRQKIQKRGGGGREKSAHVVKKPMNLAGRAEKNPAQDKADTAVRVQARRRSTGNSSTPNFTASSCSISVVAAARPR